MPAGPPALGDRSQSPVGSGSSWGLAGPGGRRGAVGRVLAVLVRRPLRRRPPPPAPWHPSAPPGLTGLLADPPPPDVLAAGVAAGEARLTAAGGGIDRTGNGWGTRSRGAAFGDDVAYRAAFAKYSLAGHLPAENRSYSRVIDGRRPAVLRLAAGEPPVAGFWSLTLYGPDMFLVDNEIGRHSIGDRTPGLCREPDGSLAVTIGHDSPAGTANWLPAPAGPCVLVLRAYEGAASVVAATWFPPDSRTTPGSPPPSAPPDRRARRCGRRDRSAVALDADCTATSTNPPTTGTAADAAGGRRRPGGRLPRRGTCADGTGSGDAGGSPDPTDTAATATSREDLDEMTDVDLAAEAYVAGYPLVVSMRTLQRLGGLLGVNRLFWQPALAGPDSRTVVAPNRDTLYSIAVLDLRSEPVALTVPEIDDRYFTYQFLDTWTESFAYVGTRATGGEAGTWLVAPRLGRRGAPRRRGAAVGHAARVPARAVPRRRRGRRRRGRSDQPRGVPPPLSALTGDDAAAPPPPLGEPAGTPQAIPTDASFYDELGDALSINPPPTPAQDALFAALDARGLGPGSDGSTSSSAPPGPPAVRATLDEAAAQGDARIRAGVADRSDLVGGWSGNREVGRYGDDLDLRALVARIGWGANVPEEALYPVARVDADGNPLNGSSTYRIRFEPGELPPVEAFWSLSVYGPDMFFVPHPSGRYSIGDRTPDLALEPDGSLEIVLSATEPDAPGGCRSTGYRCPRAVSC